MTVNGQVFALPMQERHTTASEYSSLPTPAASEPGFTFQPVDKDGNPTNDPNVRWYHPETGRLVQKGVKQALDEGLLRTPSVTDSTGGAISEKQARERNRMVKIADQAAELAFLNGNKVSKSITNSLLPNPNTMDHLPARHPDKIDKSKGGHANVRETVVNELMASPRATDYKGGGANEATAYGWEERGWSGPNLAEDVARLYVEAKLPTPTSRDYKDGQAEHRRDGEVQTDTVARAVFSSGEILLPTTRTSMKNGATAKELAAGNPKHRLEAVTNWGKFEPAIKQWEQVIERKAPAPTKPDGKDGAHRLSSRFTEWMMGLPDGWITDVGLTRNEELKACGNGVVPQQAELALRVLLEGVELKEDRPR
jgi:hypothetical protein